MSSFSVRKFIGVSARRPMMPRPHRQVLTLMVLAAVLCGCGSIEQARQERQQQDLESARQSCAAAGVADGTPEFARCVGTELLRTAYRRQRTLEQLEQQSLPTYVRPSVPSSRMCLPTAAGAGGPSYTCI